MNFIERFFDIRPAERKPVLATFAALLLIVVGHTMLETVRDALFLRHVGVAGLGWMYIVVAALTLAVGSFAAGIGDRFGPRRALVAMQLASAAASATFFFLPPTRNVLVGLYAFSALSGALLVPQLWSFAAALFHAGQSRRLFGTVAIAGILGAAVGSSLAATALLRTGVEFLLLGSAIAFVASAGAMGIAPRVARSRTPSAPCAKGPALSVLKQEKILGRIAAVVGLGAITTLLVDYAFKAAVTAHVAPDQLGPFFARYYAVMNVLALVVQLLIARRAIARAGVVGTTGMLPSALLTGSIVTVLTGGAFLAMLGTKVMDATFRHSVHRTGVELVYLAVPTAARNRAKPLIDGAIMRVSQAVGAGLLLVLAAVGWDSVPHVALLAMVLAFLWGAATWSLRAPYLSLFRRTLVGVPTDPGRARADLDLASAEVLVEATSSQRPREVIAAMAVLERRSRTGLVPGLVLLHEDEDVLVRALDLFGSTTRKDWIHLAEKRTSDPRERVRRAALRALARASVNVADRDRAGADERPWIRGYIALRTNAETPAELEHVVASARGRSTDASEARLGILTAIGDARPSGALADALVALLEDAPPSLSLDAVTLAARAATNVADERLIPWLLVRLERREGRSAVRAALVALGRPAYDAAAEKLRNTSTPRRLRIHLPRTLSRFGTQEAADLLYELLRSDADGLVRYKCLRGLGRLVVEHRASLPPAGLRSLAMRDLSEHFRLRGLKRSLSWQREEADGSAARTRTLLAELLAEKSQQALERVFRILKLAFPEEDIHRVHTAALQGDAASRANAAEFLDALLAPRRRGAMTDDLRPLLRLLNADLPEADAVLRAAELASFALPATPGEGLTWLVEERDVTVAALATVLVRQSAAPDATAAASKAVERRRSIAESVDALLAPPRALGSAHG